MSLNSPYKVSLGYNGKNNEFVRHEFTVAYRLNSLYYTPDEDQGTGGEGGETGNENIDTDIGITPEKPMDVPDVPEYDELLKGNTGYIKFEYGNFTSDDKIDENKTYGENKDKNTTSGNLRVSVGGSYKSEGGSSEEEYEYIVDSKAYQLGNQITKGIIPIVGIIRPGDNSGGIGAKIDKTGNDDKNGKFHQDKQYFSKGDLDSINITVSEGCILKNLKIGGEKVDAQTLEGYEKLGPGKYILTHKINGINAELFSSHFIRIEGELEKTSTEGYIIITFGKAK